MKSEGLGQAAVLQSPVGLPLSAEILTLHATDESPWLILPSAVTPGEGAESLHEQVYREYFPRAKAFFRKRGHAAEDALELTQELFVRVLRSGGRFESRELFEGWLFEIAANLHRNVMRDRQAAKRQGRESSLEQLIEEREHPGRLEKRVRALISADPEQLALALDRERRTRLAHAVQELPARARHCVWLHVYQQRSYAEVARVLQITVDTVKAHLHQARDRLRRQLAPVFEEIDF